MMKALKLEELNSGNMTEKYISTHYPEFYEYVINYYPTDLKWTEKLYWYYHGIEEHPKCPECGCDVKYVNFAKGYRMFCNKCASNSDYVRNKFKQTMIEKYGVENPFQCKEVLEKRKKTWKEKYGVENPIQNKDIEEKRKQAWKEKYGEDNIFKTDIFKEKRKQSLIERYGVEQPCANEKIMERYRKTCLERYGTEIPMLNKEVQEKRKQTCLEKYGVESTFQSKVLRQKARQTNIERYGVDVATKSKEIQHKRYLTNVKNHSFKSSKFEQEFKKWLDDNNIDYRYQYKSDKYPFNCDFYFPDKDLYLEIQGHWTHGNHPFDPNNQDDVDYLNLMKSKNTKFYDNAIDVWTIRDPRKRQWAENHKLNWVEVFSTNLDDILDACGLR